MAVFIHIESGFELPGLVSLKSLIKRVAKGEGLKASINLIFCDDPLVRQLNRDHRGLDKVTDVLSFNYDEDDLLGEIYVAVPQTERQAPRWKNSFENELRRVVVHGLLHLAGHDHHAPGERKAMRAREDHYLLGQAQDSPLKDRPTSRTTSRPSSQKPLKSKKKGKSRQ
jgi:probable rRNA maturation factor